MNEMNWPPPNQPNPEYKTIDNQGMSISSKIMILVSVFAVVFFIASVANNESDTSSTSDSGISKYEARFACEDAVKARLKAPRTAKFSNRLEIREGTYWNATGYVDAQNGFGALIRNSYYCMVNNYGVVSSVTFLN